MTEKKYEYTLVKDVSTEVTLFWPGGFKRKNIKDLSLYISSYAH